MIDAYNLQYPLDKAPIDGIYKAGVMEESCNEVKLLENAAFENHYVEKSLNENADFTHLKEFKEDKGMRKTMLVEVQQDIWLNCPLNQLRKVCGSKSFTTKSCLWEKLLQSVIRV